MLKTVLSDEWELASDCSWSLNLCIQELKPLRETSGSIELEIVSWVEMQLPNKITPEWIYKANTKGLMSKTRGPRIGRATGADCSWTIMVWYSNPYFSAAKYLHIRCCSIGAELNMAIVLDKMWVLISLSAPNRAEFAIKRWFLEPTWNPKQNKFSTLADKSLI